MSTNPKGRLIIIGGHEDKEGERTILKAVAQRARGEHGRLVIVTVASNQPEELGREYRALFKELGVGDVDVVDIRTRDEAADQKNVEKIADAKVVFSLVATSCESPARLATRQCSAACKRSITKGRQLRVRRPAQRPCPRRC